jgi:hypothetical protein
MPEEQKLQLYEAGSLDLVVKGEDAREHYQFSETKNHE